MYDRMILHRLVSNDSVVLHVVISELLFQIIFGVNKIATNLRIVLSAHTILFRLDL